MRSKRFEDISVNVEIGMTTAPTSLNKTSEEIAALETQEELGMDMEPTPLTKAPTTRRRTAKSKTATPRSSQDEETPSFIDSNGEQRAFSTGQDLELLASKTDAELKPKIMVVGVGGAGGNAVNNMMRLKLQGVDFIVCNTDAQALGQSLTGRKIRLGLGITQGLGAGSKPEVGRAAAEESIEEVLNEIQNCNMVFITAGMGGGTGTGAAPVIAQAARDRGILTVAVVTKPFNFEGNHRMRTAEKGIEDLQEYVDTLIVIPNQNLFRVANEKTTFADAFKMADDVLYSGVRGVTDLMMMPGLINLDFADIRAVMSEMGKAMMGTGEAEGENRAISAAEAAISNPLLDDVSMKGARGVLINITGGSDLTLFEVDESANRIREEVDPDANIIFGSTYDERLNGRLRVSVVATGIDAAMTMPKPWASRSKIMRNLIEDEKVELETPVSAPVESPQDTIIAENELIDFEKGAQEEARIEENFQLDDHDLDDAEQEDFFASQGKMPEPIVEDDLKPRKKNFFSRFAEKMRGGKSTEESLGEEFDYMAEPVSAKAQKPSAIQRDSTDGDILDIPSYLRRKSGK